MCDPVSATIGAAVIGAGVGAVQGSKNRKAAQSAQSANEASAERQRQQSEQAYNKANQKQPDVAGIFTKNRAAAGKGLGGTFLTGAQGASPGSLGGGGSSLLGGG